MDWQPMDTVPLNEPVVRLHMPDGTSFLAHLVPSIDSDDQDCWAWCAVNEDEAPDNWTDGVCWAVNGNLERSTQPIGWSSAEPNQC